MAVQVSGPPLLGLHEARRRTGVGKRRQQSVIVGFAEVVPEELEGLGEASHRDPVAHDLVEAPLVVEFEELLAGTGSSRHHPVDNVAVHSQVHAAFGSVEADLDDSVGVALLVDLGVVRPVLHGVAQRTGESGQRVDAAHTRVLSATQARTFGSLGRVTRVRRRQVHPERRAGRQQ